MSLNPRAFADTVVVAPAGRLDHESCDAFRADLQPHLERALSARQGIVFDLSGLDYISSGGLRCFMLASNEARARGGKIIVASPRPVVAEKMETLGFIEAATAGTYLVAKYGQYRERLPELQPIIDKMEALSA